MMFESFFSFYNTNDAYKVLVGLTLTVIVVLIGLIFVIVHSVYVGYQVESVEHALMVLQAENITLKQQNLELIQDLTKYKGYFYAVRYDGEFLYVTTLNVVAFTSTAYLFIKLFIL